MLQSIKWRRRRRKRKELVKNILPLPFAFSRGKKTGRRRRGMCKLTWKSHIAMLLCVREYIYLVCGPSKIRSNTWATKLKWLSHLRTASTLPIQFHSPYHFLYYHYTSWISISHYFFLSSTKWDAPAKRSFKKARARARFPVGTDLRAIEISFRCSLVIFYDHCCSCSSSA